MEANHSKRKKNIFLRFRENIKFPSSKRNYANVAIGGRKRKTVVFVVEGEVIYPQATGVTRRRRREVIKCDPGRVPIRGTPLEPTINNRSSPEVVRKQRLDAPRCRDASLLVVNDFRGKLKRCL